ncbi:MAG: J domain-containing protein [Actinomycetota bacterium]
MAGDYYEVLGVSPEASAEDIRSAFRRLARTHHPDATGGDPASELRYKEISEAYAVLSDPRKRQEYEAARHGVGTWASPWGSPFASTIEDIFETFFGGGATRTRSRTRARPGESIEIELDLKIEEVVFGAQRALKFERFDSCESCQGQGTEPGTHAEPCESCEGTGQVQQVRRTVLGQIMTAHPCRNCGATGWVVPDPCKECRGSGRLSSEADVPLEVPGGIDNGDRLRLNGEGEAGAAGGGRGDLYVRFNVIGDERFERVGDDLVSWAEIEMTTAALGGKVTIPTLDGDESLDIPAGTQSNETFRLRGRGVPRRTGRGRGDLVVRVLVTTPTRLSRKEKGILKELSASRGTDGGEDGTTATLRRKLGRRD